jgi:predicted nuclease of predicted toxin-antitoxin system
MKFLVDAQLPKRLAHWLTNQGYEAVHTLDLPEKNRTTDASINELSIREHYIVISKDSDFFDRYFSHLEPYKLIFLTTGNISTNELINIFNLNIESIPRAATICA